MKASMEMPYKERAAALERKHRPKVEAIMGSKHERRTARPKPGEQDRNPSQCEWCVIACHVSVGAKHGRGVVSLFREHFEALDEEGRDALIQTAMAGAVETAVAHVSSEIDKHRNENMAKDGAEVY